MNAHASLLLAIFIFMVDLALAGVQEMRLNESSSQIRFEGNAANDATRIDQQFLHHVAQAVKSHGFDRFVFRVPSGGGAEVLVQGALSFQPSLFAKAPHIREAIVLSYKKSAAPPDAFDAHLILQNPLPPDVVVTDEPVVQRLPPASEMMPEASRGAPPEAKSFSPEKAQPLGPSADAATTENANVPPPLPPSPKPYSPSSPNPYGFSIGILIPSTSTLRFNDVIIYGTGGYGSGTAELELETAPALSLEAYRKNPHGWGYRGGLIIEKARGFKSATYRVNGQTAYFVNNGTSTATLSFMTIHFSGEYTTGNLSFPIGFNVTNPTYDSGSSTSRFDYSGSLGMQGGMSVEINPNLSLDILYLMQAIRVKEMSGGTTADYGTGFNSSFNLGLKFNLPVHKP